MMPIGDKTILEILLGQMKRAGINHVAITVGHLAGLMRAFFQDGQQYNLNITYVHEEQPLGTAGPLSQVPGLCKTFLVSNGDVLTTLDIADLIRFHRQNKGICTIAMHERQVKIDLGVIEMVEGDCCISGYVEKPTIDYKVSMGLYVFEPRVLDYIPKGEYLDFPDLVKKLLAADERVVGYPFSGYWQDLGRPDDYEQAAQDFESMRALFIPE